MKEFGDLLHTSIYADVSWEKNEMKFSRSYRIFHKIKKIFQEIDYTRRIKKTFLIYFHIT